MGFWSLIRDLIVLDWLFGDDSCDYDDDSDDDSDSELDDNLDDDYYEY